MHPSSRPSCAARAEVAVPAATVAAFQRDGAVCLRGLLCAEEVALLRAGIDSQLAHPRQATHVILAGPHVDDIPERLWPETCRRPCSVCDFMLAALVAVL